MDIIQKERKVYGRLLQNFKEEYSMLNYAVKQSIKSKREKEINSKQEGYHIVISWWKKDNVLEGREQCPESKGKKVMSARGDEEQ